MIGKASEGHREAYARFAWDWGDWLDVGAGSGRDRGDWEASDERRGLSARKALRGALILLLPVNLLTFKLVYWRLLAFIELADEMLL